MHHISKQLALLFTASCLGAGCTSLLIEKTAPVHVTPQEIVSAISAKDKVFVKYTAHIREDTIPSPKGGNWVSFTLSHKAGTNHIYAKRTSFSNIGFSNNTKRVPVQEVWTDPLVNLATNSMVVWGSSFSNSKVCIVEKTENGSIAWNMCEFPPFTRKRSNWAMPTRIVLFPVAVAADIVTLPVTIIWMITLDSSSIFP